MNYVVIPAILWYGTILRISCMLYTLFLKRVVFEPLQLVPFNWENSWPQDSVLETVGWYIKLFLIYVWKSLYIQIEYKNWLFQ